MTTAEIRQKFLNFFESKGHKIVPSAPLVVKDDPTLMFINAGMNPFKDYFLGNKIAVDKRVADTQKCLRVSGKHNDLEEVGVDHYHHTLFEMLGNWSFGDYFKEESIAWAWELLTEVYKLDKDRLYVTYFEGDREDNLSADEDAKKIWKKYIAEDRIIAANKKDNFWEMGETGPCGPCSEIHIDLRSDAERAALSGKELVNKDHEQVIEIWNLVFIQFNRKADGTLENLPNQHVDTGMGLERLVRALQAKDSNYEIDVFQKIIAKTEALSNKKYGKTQEKQDIAFRVIADHIRAISMVIADGQLPSNNGAGYVIRRILRRAIRYAYSFLDVKEPFLHALVKTMVEEFGSVFPELNKQEEFVTKVVLEEEKSFLNTLEKGLALLQPHLLNRSARLSGKVAFELYDTFGFPIDLTQLIALENGKHIDIEEFDNLLLEQKTRSRADAKQETGDWTILLEDNKEEFIGYDYLDTEVRITKYRKVLKKGKELFQFALNLTPFYPEGGGQVGDSGVLEGSNGEKVSVLDTQKENDLILHFTNKLPNQLEQTFIARVNAKKRSLTERNHSATHLLHAALKTILGSHVEQRGSLVNDKVLRFDFSHPSKLTEEEVLKIQTLVNEKIKAGISLEEQRNLPISKAKEQGATALFGEKYGDTVRVISFDPNYSMELCGGTHVQNTNEIGLFKILSESSVAAGVRRIEAISSTEAENYYLSKIDILDSISALLGHPKDLLAQVEKTIKENKETKKELESLQAKAINGLKSELIGKIKENNGMNILLEKVDLPNADALKTLLFGLKPMKSNLACFLAANINGKPMLGMILDDALTGKLNAGSIIKETAREIKGGGGGQPFFATAGGSDINGLDKALAKAKEIMETA